MESPPSFCGHAEDGSKNKEFNTTIEGKSVLQSPLSLPHEGFHVFENYSLLSFFSNCQDFLDVAVYTFKNDTMLRAWLFYI